MNRVVHTIIQQKYLSIHLHIELQFCLIDQLLLLHIPYLFPTPRQMYQRLFSFLKKIMYVFLLIKNFLSIYALVTSWNVRTTERFQLVECDWDWEEKNHLPPCSVTSPPQNTRYISSQIFTLDLWSCTKLLIVLLGTEL